MANTSNTTILTTNFDVSPYYDDYDPSKGYYRIVFKPGYSVQARELTQMQTAIQQQITQFGKNIFVDGTIVIPGGFHLETNNGLPVGRGTQYVKVMDFDASNNAVNMSVWQNLLNQGKTAGNTRLSIVGQSSNITAKVVDVLDGTQSSSNTKTLYIAYTSSSSANASIKKFTNGEVLSANVNNVQYTLVAHTTDANVTGQGSRFAISSGVVFAKGYFIAFPDQSIIIDPYNPNPTARVGFYITENIVTASQDSTLLDPAQEASNYSAPGADRLELNPELDVVPIDASVDYQDFVSLFTIDSGLIKTYNANTQYNYITGALAQRTYDESGDFVVGGLSLSLKEHDNNGVNFGRYANGNNSLLYVGVGTGSGYCQGYEVLAISTMDMSTPKGLTTANVNTQLSAANMGQYVTVDEFVGGWELNKGDLINLYDTAQFRISNRGWSIATQTGNIIGTAILLSYEYVSGIPGYNAKYNVYLADINMIGSYTFSQVRSLYSTTSGSNSPFGADTVLSPITGNAVLNNVPDSTLLYYTGSDYTQSIRSVGDKSISHTSFEYNATSGVSTPVQVSTNGTFTLSISPGTEEFPYGTTSLSASELEGIYLTFDRTAGGSTTMAIGLPGVTSGTGGSTTLLGVSTHFSRLNVGDKIALSGNNSTYYITSISGDTSLTVDANLPSSITGNTLTKVYMSGDMIDLTGIGSVAGVQRTVSATPTSLSFNLQETFPSIFYVTATYSIVRTGAFEILKDLKVSRYVKINPNTNVAGPSGPFDLGFSDVYQIKTIRLVEGSYPTSNTNGRDVTQAFTFNNGQLDTHYGHATITPKGPLDSNAYLLVELDYFLPDFTNRGGYFSIDSYPIQDNDSLFDSTQNIRTENVPVFISPITGQKYDLRNQLDFRPVKINTAADATTPGSASVNPSVTESLNYPAAGMKFPVPSSLIEYDYYYYLGRTDIVAVDKNNNFQVIQGTPGPNPQTPQTPSGVMALYSLSISPYPSLSPAYAASIGRPELACTYRTLTNSRFTMRDIGVLKQRIVNLEYYTALSLLEKSASSMTITDSSGNDRFKNGVFTDSFADNTLSSTTDPEQRIVFDKQEKTIRPVYKMDSIAYNYLSGTNVWFNNPVFTVDYTEVLHYNQIYVTNDINVERQSWLFLGQVNLFPSKDIWIDTTIMPDELLQTQGVNIVTYGSQGSSNEAITAYGTTSAVSNTPLSGTYGLITNTGNFLANTTGGVIDVLNTTEWNSWNQQIVGYKVYTGDVGSDNNPIATTFSSYSAASAYASSINSAGGAGVTIETVYNTSRTGTQYWQADSTSTVMTDYKVINTSVYSYIRPQYITVQCTGMKPYTQMWPFFDNVPMANVARPVTANQFSWILNSGNFSLPANTVTYLQTGTTTVTTEGLVALPSSLGPWSDFGSPLITDSNGTLIFQFQIQSNQFQTGQRTVLVSDSRIYVDPTSITDLASVPPDVSTGGTAVFTASGQAVSLQRSILSTATVSYHNQAVSQNYTSAGFDYIAAPPPPSPCSHSCSAYSFRAFSINGEEGMFMTSVDLFISRIGKEYGFWVEIREMDSGENITRNTVPYSQVFFNDPSQVPISPDGVTNPCNVRFQAPVFLYNNTQYALVIHPINANPDLYVWISTLGQQDINGLGAVVDRRGQGTFYQTNNNTNWDIIPDTDLRVNYYRAEFQRNTQSTAYIGNVPMEKLFVKNGSIDFANNYGDIFISGDHLTLSGSNGTISVGNVLQGDLSKQNAAVVNISSGLTCVSNTGFYKGEKVHVYSSLGGSYLGIDATISNITNGQGIMNYYINGPDTSLVHLTGSGGGFVNGDYIICSTDWSQYGYLENIQAISNFTYSAYSFEPSYLNFKLSDINFQMQATSTTGVAQPYVTVDPSTTQYFNTQMAVMSRTNEVNQLSGANSNIIQVNMITASNVVAPLFDLTSTQTIIIDNIINNDTTGETLPGSGALINKYISKTVTLDEGQDAEDMQVILTAYRPPGTDVKVWIKILNGEDPASFASRPWTELYKQGNGDQVYSSLADRTNFIEYTYLVPQSTVDRVTLANTYVTGGVNVGMSLVGLTSRFSTSVDSIENGTIYVMGDSGYDSGETANVVNSTGSVIGNTQIYAIGHPPALNANYQDVSNVISYTTDAGVSYVTYKYFAIKVGLLNDGVNTAVVPRVGDLRAIALQM